MGDSIDLRIDRLSHVYENTALNNKQAVLKVFSLEIESGQQVLVCGLNASGKTTLLDIVAGKLKPAGGAVWFKHWSLYTLPAPQRRRICAAHIGYIPQILDLVPKRTVLENVELPVLSAQTFPLGLSKLRAMTLLKQVGMAKFDEHYPAQLSYSHQLQVSLARAFANVPQLVLADEPTAYLDAATGRNVLDFLQELSRCYNATLIVTTRNPTLAARFERAFTLFDGRLEEISHASTQKTLQKHQPDLFQLPHKSLQLQTG